MSRHVDVGLAPGQPELTAGGEGIALATQARVLPELEEAAQRTRSMWRHPAFLVSLGLTLLALLVAGGMLVFALLTGGSDEVAGARIETSGGNLHLQWSAAGPVALYVVTGEEVSDISQLVTGDEAWVPSALGVYESTSCFVIRPASVQAEVSLDGATLTAQGAASACVGDAG
jgi:hypothetical protein